ncbi:RICIN domain-containing protein [Dactylosporangium sp. CA-092794]|uniref:RICIN domain-containing protein n=1 Tax=Dactylosporangium sp. CA-092794 TaxID=3239929 RepID=UPI003D93B6B6
MAERSRRYAGLKRTLGALAAAAAGISVIVAPAGPASADAGRPTATVAFTAVGEHAFTVPVGVTSIHVVAVGGRGGSAYGAGGWGARVEGDVRVIPGTTIYAEVGGNGAQGTFGEGQNAAGGANGGGTGAHWAVRTDPSTENAQERSGGGGGGASDIQACSVAPACTPINHGGPDLLLVAGGGGGSGAFNAGGAGGTPNGADGELGNYYRAYMENGLGATQSASGTNNYQIANGSTAPHCDGDSGTVTTWGGGGGGGGYHCGGGGASVIYGGAGGGGSSYGPAGTTYAVAVNQDPSVTITYRTAFQLAPASRSSMALDLVGLTVVQQPSSSASSQLWSLVAQGSLYQIVNQATGQCLTTDGHAGDQLIVWPCSAQAQQLWQVPTTFGYGANGSVIYNPAYDLFVDVSGGSVAPGAAIDAQTYNGGAGQYFLTF